MLFIILYLIQLLIRPQDFSPAFLGWPTAWLIVLPGFILATLKDSSLTESNRLPQYYLLFAFLGVILLSTFLNSDMGEAVTQTNIFLKRVMAFFMVHLLIDSEKKLKFTLLLYITLVSLLGLHAILQLQTGFGFSGLQPLTFYDPWRAVWHGPWDGSNSFGVLFVTALPLCLEFILGKESTWIRNVNIVFFPLLLAGLYYVDSRGDTIAAIFALGLFATMKFSKKTNVKIFVVAIVFLGALLPARMAEINLSESSAHERTWVWEQGIRLLLENPLLGVGAGQFLNNTSSGLLAHSNYVTAFSELGLVGFFIYLSLCWVFLKGLLKVYCSGDDLIFIKSSITSFIGNTQEKPEELKGLARGLIASLCGFYAATFFIVLWNDLLFFLWAMGASLWVVSVKESHENVEINKFDVSLVLFGVFSLIAIIWYIAEKA